VPCFSKALEKYNIEKDIAAFIKKEFDKKYGPTWHCIVGRNFGAWTTPERALRPRSPNCCAALRYRRCAAALRCCGAACWDARRSAVQRNAALS
jgi:hypothetical protein